MLPGKIKMPETLRVRKQLVRAEKLYLNETCSYSSIAKYGSRTIQFSDELKIYFSIVWIKQCEIYNTRFHSNYNE